MNFHYSQNTIAGIILRKLFPYIGLLITTIILHSNHPINSDEGVILAGAWDLINGKKPYTDFFAIIPPASFYVIYWLWTLFGVSYFAAKLLAIIFVFVSSVGVYKINSLFTKISPF